MEWYELRWNIDQPLNTDFRLTSLYTVKPKDLLEP